MDFFSTSFLTSHYNLSSMENLSVFLIWCIIFAFKYTCDLHPKHYATFLFKSTFEGRIPRYPKTKVQNVSFMDIS